MKLKNKGVRAYHVGGVLVAPGKTEEVPDSAKADIKGLEDLEIAGKVKEEAEEVEFTETEEKHTKAELQALLDEAGVEYPSNANKAELQALVDGIQ